MERILRVVCDQASQECEVDIRPLVVLGDGQDVLDTEPTALIAGDTLTPRGGGADVPEQLGKLATNVVPNVFNVTCLLSPPDGLPEAIRPTRDVASVHHTERGIIRSVLQHVRGPELLSLIHFSEPPSPD